MEFDLYSILELEQSATSSDIKKAYRKLALRYHPDKASEEDRLDAEIKFKEISRAYEILSDEAKRMDYDMYGTTDGFADAGTSGFSGNPFGDTYGPNTYGAEDFSNFFTNMNNGMPPRSGAGYKPRTEDAEMEVEVTLEDLFKGKTVKITSTRNIICHSCNGSGARKKASLRVCSSCNGQGYTTKIKRVAPGLVSQFHVDCEVCHGEGKVIRSKDKCKTCSGSKVTEETKILEFEITPGSQSGESVILKGESDQAPGKQAGDVILTFHCKDHATFKRKGDDLFLRYKITLVDALSGFSRVVGKHLDGRVIHVTTAKGKVARPGDFIRLTGEGMPKKSESSHWFGSSKKRGDLYIALDIEFPQDNWYLEKNDIYKLQNLLPTELSNESDRKAQEVPEDSLMEPNITYFTEFSLVGQDALPDYGKFERESHKKTNGDNHRQGTNTGEPQCTTQ